MELTLMDAESGDNQETKLVAELHLMSSPQDVLCKTDGSDNTLDQQTPTDVVEKIKREPVSHCDYSDYHQANIDYNVIKEEPTEYVIEEESLLTDEIHGVEENTSADKPVPVALYKIDIKQTCGVEGNICADKVVPAAVYKGDIEQTRGVEGNTSADKLSPVAMYKVDIESGIHEGLIPDISGDECHKFSPNSEKAAVLQPCTCSLCPFTSTSTKIMNMHARTLFDKPYKCSTCSYRTDHQGNLKTHERTHTDEKPYKCSLCPYTCTQKGSLGYHEHTHTDVKPYKCSFCPYSSAYKGGLKYHERAHTGVKPYKCALCPYASAGKANLEYHEQIHTGVKPYKCSFCSYSRAHRGSLKNHERTHTGEKPYKCSLCSYSSIRQVHLQKHERTHASEKQSIADMYPCSAV